MIIFNTGGELNVVNHPSRPVIPIEVVPSGLVYNLPFNLEAIYYAGFISVRVYNKSTRVITDFVDIEATYDSGVITFTLPFTGEENTQYYLIVSDSDDSLLFNSNALCTDETNLQDFSIISNEFITPPQTDNTFKQHE